MLSFLKTKRAKQLAPTSLLFPNLRKNFAMQNSQIKVAYSLGARTFEVAFVKVSEPTIRLALLLGWSAFLLWLLLEAMKIYQF